MGFDENGYIHVDRKWDDDDPNRWDEESRMGAMTREWRGYIREMAKWCKRRGGAFIFSLPRRTVIASAIGLVLCLVAIVSVSVMFPAHEKALPETGSETSAPAAPMSEETIKSATGRMLVGMSPEAAVELAGGLGYHDYRESGMMASVTAAQILWNSKADSAPTDLARYYSNLFSLQATFQNAGWEGSTWDGKAVDLDYKKYLNGDWLNGNAPFRVYDTLWTGVKDYSSYVIHITNEDGTLRFPDATKIRDPYQLVDVLAAGQYSTDPDYAQEMKELIDKYNLTRFDHI